MILAIGMEGILVPANFNGMGSRYEQRTKRRKTNIILNSLIAIVITLILIVGWNIFLKDNKTEQLKKDEEKIIKQETTDQKKEANETETYKNDTSVEKEELDEVIVKNSDEPNVEEVIIDPSWQPIGTEQTSGHQPSREMGSLDWQEKEKAAAYALNISVENMTNWWTERGDDPDKEAILTVSEKGSSDTYRVYIEWVEGAGWKPTEVKKLVTNDRKQ